jgi:tetratricopeptide (TPR) repeat protein
MAEATLAYEIEPGAGPEPRKRKTGLFVAAAIAVVAALSGGAYLLFSSRPAKSSESAPVSAAVSSSATAAAGVEAAASEAAALVRLRQSFDAKSYEETVRLANAVLAKEPDNAPAQDYLSKANAAIKASEIAQTLQSGIADYARGDFARCVVEMRKVLAIDKDNQEARKYLLQAETALAAPEIKRLIESHRVAVENKDLLTVLSLYDSSSPADALKSEFKPLFNGYDGIKVIISKVTVSLSGTQGGTAVFGELITAVDKKTGQRRIVFEGQKRWRLRKQPTGWKISASQ